MADLKRLQTAVEVGDRETAVEVTQQAIDEAIQQSRAALWCLAGEVGPPRVVAPLHAGRESFGHLGRFARAPLQPSNGREADQLPLTPGQPPRGPPGHASPAHYGPATAPDR